MLVNRSEDFLIGAHLHAAINHRQAFGGAAGEGDLCRFGLQIPTGPKPYVFFALVGHAQVPVHGQPGIQVQRGAVTGDGLAHGFGVGGHQKVGEVDVVRVLVEQLTQLRPLVPGQRLRLRGGDR